MFVQVASRVSILAEWNRNSGFSAEFHKSPILVSRQDGISIRFIVQSHNN